MKMTQTVHVLGKVEIRPDSADPDKGFTGEVHLEAFGGRLKADFRFLFVCLGHHPVELTIWKGDQEIGRLTKSGACAETVIKQNQLAFFGNAVQEATVRYLEWFRATSDGLRAPNQYTWSFECDPQPERIETILGLFN